MSALPAEIPALAAPPELDRPRLSPACSFHVYDGGNGREEYVLGVDGRHFRISALARRILERLDGETSLEEIAADLRRDAVSISAGELRVLLAERYSALGVFAPRALAPAAPESRRSGLPFFLAWDVVPRRPLGRLAGALGFLYSWPGVALLALAALAHGLVYAHPLTVSVLSPERCLAIFALTVVSILVHELGHAAAISRFGGTPGAIGCGLYLLMPTFYADVSQIWRFPRRHRMVVDLGGVYFQQLCFGAFAAAGAASGRLELLAACRMIDVMTLMTLNPLFRFDGYWLLVDYLGIPRLQSLALRYPGYLLRRLAGRPAAPPELPPLGRAARLVFRAYAAFSGVFLVALLGLAWRSLHGAFLAFPAIVPVALREARAALAAGDLLGLAYRLLVFLLLLAFPASALLGIALYLRGACLWCAVRLTRAFGRRTGVLRKRET